MSQPEIVSDGLSLFPRAHSLEQLQEALSCLFTRTKETADLSHGGSLPPLAPVMTSHHQALASFPCNYSTV